LQNLLKSLDRLNEAKGFARELDSLVNRHINLARDLADDMPDGIGKQKLKAAADELEELRTQLIKNITDAFEDDSNPFALEKLNKMLGQIK
jgi:hypothetical protein